MVGWGAPDDAAPNDGANWRLVRGATVRRCLLVAGVTLIYKAPAAHVRQGLIPQLAVSRFVDKAGFSSRHILARLSFRLLVIHNCLLEARGQEDCPGSSIHLESMLRLVRPNPPRRTTKIVLRLT